MEWISVKERLPEINQDVLIYNEHFKIYEVGHVFEDEYDKYSMQDNGFYILFFIKSMMWSNNEATHWMPLPEPPKL